MPKYASSETVVDKRVEGDGSEDRTGDGQTIPCSSYPAINTGLHVPKMAGTKESGREPLLLHHVVEIRGKWRCGQE